MKVKCTSCGMVLEGFAAMPPHVYEHMEIEFMLGDLIEVIGSDFPIMFLPMEEE